MSFLSILRSFFQKGPSTIPAFSLSKEPAMKRVSEKELFNKINAGIKNTTHKVPLSILTNLKPVTPKNITMDLMHINSTEDKITEEMKYLIKQSATINAFLYQQELPPQLITYDALTANYIKLIREKLKLSPLIDQDEVVTIGAKGLPELPVHYARSETGAQFPYYFDAEFEKLIDPWKAPASYKTKYFIEASKYLESIGILIMMNHKEKTFMTIESFMAALAAMDLKFANMSVVRKKSLITVFSIKNKVPVPASYILITGLTIGMLHFLSKTPVVNKSVSSLRVVK